MWLALPRFQSDLSNLLYCYRVVFSIMVNLFYFYKRRQGDLHQVPKPVPPFTVLGIQLLLLLASPILKIEMFPDWICTNISTTPTAFAFQSAIFIGFEPKRFSHKGCCISNLPQGIRISVSVTLQIVTHKIFCNNFQGIVARVIYFWWSH